MASSARSTTNVTNINVERAHEVQIGPDGAVRIKMDWDKLDEVEKDKIRNEVKAEVESHIQRLEKDLKKEKAKCVKRMRSLAEKFVELLKECDDQCGELPQECEDILQELTDTKEETKRKEKEWQTQIDKARADGERRVQKVVKDFESEKRKEREKATSYVLQLREETGQLRQKLLSEIPDEKLRETVQRLFDKFQIRVLGIDSDLVFLMDSILGEKSVLQLQEDIRKVLTQLLPEDAVGKVKWSEMAAVARAIDPKSLRAGQPLPQDVRDLASALKTSTALIQAGVVLGTGAAVVTGVGALAVQGSMAVAVGAGVAAGTVVAAPFVMLGALGFGAAALFYGKKKED